MSIYTHFDRAGMQKGLREQATELQRQPSMPSVAPPPIPFHVDKVEEKSFEPSSSASHQDTEKRAKSPFEKPDLEDDEISTSCDEYADYLTSCLSEEDTEIERTTAAASKTKTSSLLRREETGLSLIKEKIIIPEDALRRDIRLGQGQFGAVYRGKWAPAIGFEFPVAIKEIQSHRLEDDEHQSLNQELATWYKISKTLEFSDGHHLTLWCLMES